MPSPDVLVIIIAGLLAANVATAIGWFVVLHRKGHFEPPAHQPGVSASGSVATAVPTIAQPEVQLDIAKLQASAQAAFEQTITTATEDFRQDLSKSSGKLGDLIVRLTTDSVEQELTIYKGQLTEARAAALRSLQHMQATVETRQKEIESGVTAAVAERQAELVQRLDTKLGAAVVAYVVESLGMNADLGAQKAFLLENLERHKEELKQEIRRGHSA